MTRLFSNNAATTLSAAVTTTGQLSFTVANGAVFPTPVAPDYFIATLTQATTETSFEDVKVTARSGNTLTVERGQNGSTAATWASGDKLEIRWDAVASADAANTGVAGSAVLDFGAAPGSNMATVTIVGQTDIKSNALAQAWIMAVDSADHNSMEHVIVPMEVRCGNIVAGGSFDIFGYSPLRLTGQWAVQWVRTR